jgi:hypothetical protein
MSTAVNWRANSQRAHQVIRTGLHRANCSHSIGVSWMRSQRFTGFDVLQEETQIMSTRLAQLTRTLSLWVSTLMILAGVTLTAQKDTAGVSDADATGPAFEVATIRPANRDDGRNWFGMKLDASGRFQASAVPLSLLVSAAYAAAPPTEGDDRSRSARLGEFGSV